MHKTYETMKIFIQLLILTAFVAKEIKSAETTESTPPPAATPYFSYYWGKTICYEKKILLEKRFLKAITDGDLEEVSSTLDKCVNPNICFRTKDSDFERTDYTTPLIYAVKRNNIGLMRLLLSHPKNPALVNYYITKRRVLLQNGGSFLDIVQAHRKNPFDDGNKGWWENRDTALHHAVRTNNVAATKLLLEFGAKVNEPGRDGLLPLTIAHSKPITRLLLSNGADPRETEADRRTPYHHAAEEGHYYKIIEFTQYTIPFSRRDVYGETPLMIMAKNPHRYYSIVEFLSILNTEKGIAQVQNNQNLYNAVMADLLKSHALATENKLRENAKFLKHYIKKLWELPKDESPKNVSEEELQPSKRQRIGSKDLSRK